MPDGKFYVDGGLWAIDPGVVALAEAARIIDRKKVTSTTEDGSVQLRLLQGCPTSEDDYSLDRPFARFFPSSNSVISPFADIVVNSKYGARNMIPPTTPTIPNAIPLGEKS